MQGKLSLNDVHHILKIAGIQNFSGKYEPLGRGEVNDTYKLGLDNETIVLRVARDKGQRTLKAEAKTLSLLNVPQVPKLIFFDKDSLVNGRLWILESYIPGKIQERLILKQFQSLGRLLAQIHKITDTNAKLNLREQFLEANNYFGDETYFLNHPDARLKKLIKDVFEEFQKLQSKYDSIIPSLVHGDATPSNILADGNEIGLIDWEFSRFSDPMLEFSTIYYEDIEYNQGKWRIKIQPGEKQALFDGYEQGGGKIDDERIRFWIKFDKLGALTFQYWRLNESSREMAPAERRQFELDYNNLISSLNN